jgi:oligopeptide/dipeptide ABC transporter ATP-binding protein
VSTEPLLRVEDLESHFFTSAGVVRAVDKVSFHVDAGETVAIVGESGCGKTVTALSILSLVPDPGKVVGGQVWFRGRDVLGMNRHEIQDFRGSEVAMIFQDPMTSLNPVLKIGFQIKETMTAHHRFDRSQAAARVVPLLNKVRIPEAAWRARDFPHQFSGGMRQRAMIAMGLANEPALLIADEPTTSLDVTVQAQIIELLRDINRDLGTAVILITHNLAIVASLCSRVIVMYGGRVVESGSTTQIFEHPQHPYTWSLLQSIPRLDQPRDQLLTIAGLPPDLRRPPSGCLFHPRCRFRVERCLKEEPPLVEVSPGHWARCWVTMKKALADEPTRG